MLVRSWTPSTSRRYTGQNSAVMLLARAQESLRRRKAVGEVGQLRIPRRRGDEAVTLRRRHRKLRWSWTTTKWTSSTVPRPTRSRSWCRRRTRRSCRGGSSNSLERAGQSNGWRRWLRKPGRASTMTDEPTLTPRRTVTARESKRELREKALRELLASGSRPLVRN